ncbi:MAG TPA: glycosyltransferase family 4 protein [Geobacteraceae bacterium]|nr:glycosyltransferase family 4 protein [Geobacteraceae bacterium]
MKVLFIHNHYRTSSPSGEDSVARNERKLLEDNGIDVISYEKFNDAIDDSSMIKKLRLAIDTVWSQQTYQEVVALIKRERPDIAHVHSLHPQVSPSVYSACQRMGVPVVHTLHNYRYICPGALLMRAGKPCEECVGRVPLKALLYRCYRNSLGATGALVGMLCYNRLRKTFYNRVNRYITLTEFAKSRLMAGGLPAERIEIKPNFLAQSPAAVNERGNYAVFVGRLSEEKGVKTLCAAWPLVKGLPLKIAGDGPLRQELEALARDRQLVVEFLGALPREKVLKLVAGAVLQVVPSECYEGFPNVILEAYACATPVVASRIGSLAEIVLDGCTGLHFEAGNTDDLARKVNMLAADRELALRMGKRARGLFMEKYTPERNFNMLMGIYQRAREDFERRRRE